MWGPHNGDPMGITLLKSCKDNFKCTRSFDSHHYDNISSVSENDSSDKMNRTYTGFMISPNMESCILGYVIKNLKISYMCKISEVY